MPTPKKAATPKNALSKPVQPDAALAAVVGKDPLPRTELTKRLWEYVRKHELQDPKDKRSIRADEKLLAVFDGKKGSAGWNTEKTGSVSWTKTRGEKRREPVPERSLEVRIERTGCRGWLAYSSAPNICHTE